MLSEKQLAVTAEGNAPQSGVDEHAAEKLANELEGKAVASGVPGPQPAGSGGAAAQMAAAAGHSGNSPQLTTQSDEWERLAAEMPNRDLHVPLVDPMFDTGKRFVLAELARPELTAADGEGRGSAVRLSFKVEEELTSTDGQKKSPGYVFRPRPFILVPVDANGRQKAEMSQRDLGKLLICAGLASKAEALSVGQMTSRLGKLAGLKVGVKFATKKSTKRDPETGQPYVNQNLFFTSAEAAKANGDSSHEAGEGSPESGEVPNY